MSYLIHESNSIFSTLILIVLKRHVPWILKLQYWHGPLDWCCKMQIFNSVCMFIFSQPYFLLSIFFILSKNSLKCLIFTINFFLIYLFSLLRRKIFDNIVVRYCSYIYMLCVQYDTVGVICYQYHHHHYHHHFNS